MQRRGLPRKTGALFVVLFYLTVFVGRARAAEPVPLRLDYTAPLACPAASDFLDEVAARTALARVARPDEPATALTITIREVAGGNKGTLRFASQAGTSSAREVSAADCAQVVSALALMTALAIDPDASTEPVRTLPKPPPPLPRVVPRLKVAPLPTPAPRRRWRVQAGADAEALGGVAPDLVLFVRPFVELAYAGSNWSSAVRLSAGFGRGAVRASDGGGEFTLFSGRLEGCPARYQLFGTLRLSPCVTLDVGRLAASGTFVTPAEQVDRPWVAPGAVGRLEWEIVRVLMLEVAGEALFPVVRDRFFVASDTTLHRTPAVAGGVMAGLGVLFP